MGIGRIQTEADLDAAIRSGTRALENVARTLQATVRVGQGSPEGVVAAPVGTLWLRTDGGVGSTLYVKEANGGQPTGWAAK